MRRTILFGAYIFFTAAASLFLYSCEDANPLDCIKNTGEIVKEERAIDSNIRTVVLYDNVNLVLTQSTNQYLEIEAGKNLQKNIKIKIQHDTLIISNNNICNWIRDYKKEIIAYLNIGNLYNIEYRGSGDISCTNTIENDSIRLDVWEGAGKVELDINVQTNQTYLHIGTADIHLSGTCNTNLISSKSYGLVNAQHLISSYTYISSSSSNHCYVNTIHHLDARIYSIGNIYYANEPQLIKTYITGSGQVLPLE